MAFYSGASGGTWDLVVETAFDRFVEFDLREIPQYRSVIDKFPGQQAMPGETIQLTLHKDLPVTKTPLNETVDVTPQAPVTPVRVPVTLNEYGMSTLTTDFLRTLSFTQVERDRATLIARQMADTLDELILDVMNTSTNVYRKNAGVLKKTATRILVGAGDTLAAKDVSAASTLLRRAKVVPKMGDAYLSFIHPDVAFDIREQAATAGGTWRAPKEYVDTKDIYTGELGLYAGARFVETTRNSVFAAAGAGAPAADVYATYFIGRQSIVEASAVEPHTVIGNQTDTLKRFWPLGWKSLLGWALYRSEALVRIETSSSITPVLA